MTALEVSFSPRGMPRAPESRASFTYCSQEPPIERLHNALASSTVSVTGVTGPAGHSRPVGL